MFSLVLSLPALTIHSSLVLSLFLSSLHLPAFHYCPIVCVYLCLFHYFLCFSIFLSSACSLSPGSTGTSLATPTQHFPSPRAVSKDSCKAGRLCLTLKTKPPLVDAGGRIIDCMNKVGRGEERKRTSQLPLGLFFLIYLEVSEGQMHLQSHLRAGVGPGSRC